MTKRPVPASRPLFMRRHRFASVPGLSLPYQPRISRTRSFIAEGLLSSYRRRRGPIGAVAAAAARPATALAVRRDAVPKNLERRLVDPPDGARVDLRVAMEAEAARLAARVEMHVRQDVTRAARAAGHREPVRHAPVSMPSAASSS